MGAVCTSGPESALTKVKNIPVGNSSGIEILSYNQEFEVQMALAEDSS